MEVYEYHSNITQKRHGASRNYRYVLDVSNSISQRDLKKKRFNPLTKLIVMLFFFRFERLTWKGHGFLYPWFSFLPMSSCDEVFSIVLLAFVRCFFFSNLGRIILLLILIFRFGTVFSLSIGGRYTVEINSWLFTCNRIIGIVSLLVFLLLLLWRANNFFFLHLRILLDSPRMPLWIERILSASSSSGLNLEGLQIILFGIVSKQIFLHIRNLFKLSLNHMKMLHKTFNIINCST